MGCLSAFNGLQITPVKIYTFSEEVRANNTRASMVPNAVVICILLPEALITRDEGERHS